MPYKIRKLRSKNEYIVKNSKTNELVSHHDSLDKAQKKIRLLNKIEFEEKLKNMKFPINPFLEN
jgi:hypothetical protein